MQILSKPVRWTSAASASRDDLVRRLFPSIRYELAQISTALSLEAASASRWRNTDDRNLGEVRSAEGRAKALMDRADVLMCAVSALEADVRPRKRGVDLAFVANLAMLFTQHAIYQTGSSVCLNSMATATSSGADAVGTLHLLLVLILECADASPGVIHLSAKTDHDSVQLSISASSAVKDRLSGLHSELGLLASAAGGGLSFSGSAIVLAFRINDASAHTPDLDESDLGAFEFVGRRTTR